MGVTNFPDGVNAGDSAGNAAELQVGGTAISPIAGVAAGYKIARGTAILSNAGTVDVTTGLSDVLFAVVSPYGALSSTAGTVGGFVSASSQVKSSGVLLIRGNDQFGTASAVAGTASWIAVGT